jgi:hypothetical protein
MPNTNLLNPDALANENSGCRKFSLCRRFMKPENDTFPANSFVLGTSLTPTLSLAAAEDICKYSSFYFLQINFDFLVSSGK